MTQSIQVLTDGVEDVLHPVLVKGCAGAATVTRYYRQSDALKAGDRSNAIILLRNQDNTTAYGEWRHGLTGTKRHQEPLIIWCASKELIRKDVYCNGRKKGSYRYLLSII